MVGALVTERVYCYGESLDSTDTILYTDEGLVLQVIKDYMEEHQGITRSELMEAFLSDLNADYVTMIDYPETKVFQGISITIAYVSSSEIVYFSAPMGW